MPEKYIVVENAGYEGEQDIREFRHWCDAYDFIAKTYSPDELAELHVAIAFEVDGRREF